MPPPAKRLALAEPTGGFWLLTLGTDGQVLTADAAQPDGMKWSPASVVKAYTEYLEAVSVGTAVLNADPAVSNVYKVTMTGNPTINILSNATGYAALSMTMFLIHSGAGRLVTWGAMIKWAGSAPVLSTAAGKTDVITFASPDQGTTWYGAVSNIGY